MSDETHNADSAAAVENGSNVRRAVYQLNKMAIFARMAAFEKINANDYL